jgi:3-hydroxyisobutyrate dehydrogenase
MAKIGFIGLGHMGLPMAINLVKAGHQITGYDLQQHALKSFSEACGLSGTCLQDAVLGQDIIISMLANGQQVLQVCEGVNGIIAQAPKGSLYIDCSTIDVPTARKIHQLANRAHLLVLDAPVSGGV